MSTIQSQPSLIKNQNPICREEQNKFDGLSSQDFYWYGVGHFINDLMAGCWFNYLLFFLKIVVKTPAASTALLVGQICDGFATPIVGYLSDRQTTKFGTNQLMKGRRTPWYIFGLILIVTSFIPIFHVYKSEDSINQFLYYSIFPGIFNIGWACVQISHMSLAPALTCSRKRRDRLNNYRNSFSFLSNLFVLGLGLIVFYFLTDKELQYKLIAYTVTAVGVINSFLFLCNIDEVKLTKQCEEKKIALKEKIKNKKTSLNPSQSTLTSQQPQTDRNFIKTISDEMEQKNQNNIHNKTESSIKYWFLQPKFYLFGIVYMCVRLNSNIFGTFLPFYLVGVLKITEDSKNETIPFAVALVPLFVYFSSTIISAKLSRFYQKIGRKNVFLIGTLIGTLSLGFVYFLGYQNRNYIYPIALLIGCSQSMILSTGINFISDVIGTKTDNGAFVFGIYSFLDKISAGLIIFIIANNEAFAFSTQTINEQHAQFIKISVLLIPIIVSIVATIIVISFTISEYVDSKKKTLSESKFERQEFVNSITFN